MTYRGGYGCGCVYVRVKNLQSHDALTHSQTSQTLLGNRRLEHCASKRLG